MWPTGRMWVLVLLSLSACCVCCALAALVWYGGSQTPAGAPGLPPRSDADDRCVTNMLPDDSGSCFALVYNQCAQGYTDPSSIPGSIRAKKSHALAQLHDIQKSNFEGVPRDWAAVCVARPESAGKGKCKSVPVGGFRVWARGKNPPNSAECPSSKGLFLKAHYISDGTIQGQYTGTVGHI